MRLSVALTGANGFIGQALTAYLGKKHPTWPVFWITRNPSSSKNFLQCDLSDSQKLRKILVRTKPQFIFHLAGGRYPDRQDLISSNCLTTTSLLETIQKIPDYSPRIIIPGTAAEYGKRNSGILVREHDPVCPLSEYGQAKLQQTLIGLKFAGQGMDVLVARIFNIMGPGTPTHLAAGKFANDIALIEKQIGDGILRTKNLDGKRDFLDILDVCSALVLLARKGQPNEVYNVCSGKAVGIRSMVNELRKMSSRARDITVQEDSQFHSKSFDVIGSNAKLKKQTGWMPRVTFKRSLQLTLAYYRKHPQMANPDL